MTRTGSTRSAATLFAACMLAACGGGSSSGMYPAMTTGATGYVATHLVAGVNGSANPYSAGNVDPLLVNAWGLAFNPQGFAWVANAGTSTSTLYDGNGVRQAPVVTIPAGVAGGASPTGIVFNPAPGFMITQTGVTAPSVFIFVGQAGTVAAWSPTVNATAALTVVDRGATGTVYKGAALAPTAAGTLLYATDFHNAKVDVFDSNFAPVAAPGGFVDATLPAGYAPFGIQAIGASIYVTFAKQDALAHDSVDGAGLGIVDVFDTGGNLVKHLVGAGGALNAPWGIARAPADFGAFSNALLVGNLGDGRINAFDPASGTLLGTLATSGSPIAIDGLWGIAFGNGIDAQPANTLFYAAGPTGGTQGVYGRIDSR